MLQLDLSAKTAPELPVGCSAASAPVAPGPRSQVSEPSGPTVISSESLDASGATAAVLLTFFTACPVHIQLHVYQHDAAQLHTHTHTHMSL